MMPAVHRGRGAASRRSRRPGGVLLLLAPLSLTFCVTCAAVTLGERGSGRTSLTGQQPEDQSGKPADVSKMGNTDGLSPGNAPAALTLLSWGEGVGFETMTFDAATGLKLGGAVFPQWESAKTSPSCGAFNPVLGAWHFVSANAQVVTIDAKTNAVLHSPTMPTGEFAFQVSALVVDPTIGTLYVVGVLIGSPPCQTFTMFRVDPATANLTEVGPVDIGSIEACVGTFVPPPPPSALSPGAIPPVTAVGGAVALVSRLAIQTFSVTDGRSLTNLTLPRSLGDVFQFAFNPVAREFVVAHERNDGSKAVAGVASLDAATGVVTDRFAFPHNLAGQPFMGQGPGLVAGGAFLVQVKNNTFPDQPPYVAPLYSLAMTPSGTHEWAATVVDSPFGIYDSFMGLGVLR